MLEKGYYNNIIFMNSIQIAFRRGYICIRGLILDPGFTDPTLSELLKRFANLWKIRGKNGAPPVG